MENNLAKKIFGARDHVSREQFDEALSKGEGISNHDAQKIMQSKFEQDAFDGFEKLGVTTSEMSELDQRMERHLTGSQNSSSNSLYIIGIWLLSILGVLTSAYLLNEEPKIVLAKQDSAHVGDDVKSLDSGNETPENTKEIELTDERFIVVPIQPKKSEKGSTNPKQDEKPQLIRDEIPQRMQPLSAIQLDQRNKNNNIKRPMAKEVMLSDFIFVDYRGIREERIFQDSDLTGLRANLHSEGDSQKTDEVPFDKNKVSYHAYLAETALILKTRNWAGAAQRFEIILKQYPEDVNALFYMAFIKYNQNAYGESLRYLDLIETAYHGNFEQESQWYKLKNYMELKNYDLAQKQAQKIIESDGFYKKQAEELLKNMRR